MTGLCETSVPRNESREFGKVFSDWACGVPYMVNPDADTVTTEHTACSYQEAESGEANSLPTSGTCS